MFRWDLWEAGCQLSDYNSSMQLPEASLVDIPENSIQEKRNEEANKNTQIYLVVHGQFWGVSQRQIHISQDFGHNMQCWLLDSSLSSSFACHCSFSEMN